MYKAKGSTHFVKSGLYPDLRKWYEIIKLGWTKLRPYLMASNSIIGLRNTIIIHMSRLQLVNIEFKLGLSTSNPNDDSVIFKPFKRIIESGKETGHVSYMFLNTDDENGVSVENEICTIDELLKSEEFQAKIPPDKIKVLGCICHTKGGQILFYPSFTTSYFTKFKNRDQPERHIEKINIDHFSLEPSFKKWHITHPGGHIKDLKTCKIEDNLTYWFGMSINSEVKLEQVYRNNTFAYLCPLSDAERRIQDIESSLKYRDEHLITPPIGDKYNKEDSFYHFEFYIKKDSSIEDKKIDPFHLPGSSILYIQMSEECQYFCYDIDIPKFKGKLVLVAAKITGILTDDIILNSC